MNDFIITRENAERVHWAVDIIDLIDRADRVVIMKADFFENNGHGLCLSWNFDPADANDAVSIYGQAACIGDWLLECGKHVTFDAPEAGHLLAVCSPFSDVETNELVGRLVEDPFDPQDDPSTSYWIPASRAAKGGAA